MPTVSHAYRRWALCSAFLFWLLLSAVGCQSSLRVSVQSAANMNDGKPLYLVVRAVSSSSFLSEGYDVVAQKVFSFPRDESILFRESIFPGNAAEFTIERPEDGDVAVYAFFTKPGDTWRVSLRKPIPTDVLIELGSNDIKRMIIRSQ
ncbi:MAG: hypothetical protein RL701_3908 [Pseudomonadota bacterium]